MVSPTKRKRARVRRTLPPQFAKNRPSTEDAFHADHRSRPNRGTSIFAGHEGPFIGFVHPAFASTTSVVEEHPGAFAGIARPSVEKLRCGQGRGSCHSVD